MKLKGDIRNANELLISKKVESILAGNVWNSWRTALGGLDKKFKVLEAKLSRHIVKLGEYNIGVKKNEEFIGWKIILEKLYESGFSKSNLEYFIENKKRFDRWSSEIMEFNKENGRFPAREDLWELGIPIERIESMVDYYNLEIKENIISFLSKSDIEKIDELSIKALKSVNRSEAEIILKVDDLVLKYGFNLTDAKITVAFVNEVMNKSFIGAKISKPETLKY